MTLFVLTAILSVKSNCMGKACCAVGCSNRFIKGSGVHFPQDEERKSQWIAAVGPAQRLDSKLVLLDM